MDQDLNDLYKRITEAAEREAMEKLSAACNAFANALGAAGVSSDAAVISAVIYQSDGWKPLPVYRFGELARVFFESARDQIHRNAIMAFWSQHRADAAELDNVKRELGMANAEITEFVKVVRAALNATESQFSSGERVVQKLLRPVAEQYECY